MTYLKSPRTATHDTYALVVVVHPNIQIYVESLVGTLKQRHSYDLPFIPVD